MPSAQLRPSRIAINAQKVSTSQSYHAAGSSRYVFNLLRELRDQAPPEEFVAYLSDTLLPGELAERERFLVRQTNWPTHIPAVRIAWEQIVLPHQLKRDRVTLFHGAINALPVAWTGPSVVTILDLTFLLMPHAFNRRNRAYLHWMVRHTARRADQIITISDATRHDVVHLLGAEPQRVTRVHCGVDERFKPMRGTAVLDAFRRKRGLPDRFILYLGTIEPRKNLIRLIDAYLDLRRDGRIDLPLILAGGSGWRNDDISKRIADAGPQSGVFRVGYVPEEDLALWYNAADLFVYVSEYEGFGLPPLEALACGTPVVASNCSSIPEVVGNAAMLVDPTDVDSIADGMRQVLDDRVLHAHLSAAGPERASSFTWKRMAEETLAIYRTVSNTR